MKQVPVTEIKKWSNNLPFSNINFLINEKLVVAEIVQDLPYCKMFKIIGHSEIDYVTNTLSNLSSNVGEIQFIFK